MPEEHEQLNTEQGDTTKGSASAETKKAEIMIPKDRFDEVNRKYQELVKAQQESEAEAKRTLEAQLAEQNKFQELAEQRRIEVEKLKAQASKLPAYEDAMQKVLDAQLQELPEDLRDLIPEELSVEQQLGWLAKNKAKLLKPAAPDKMGAGQKGGAGSTSIDLSPEEISTAKQYGLTAEEYEQFKDKE